MTTASNLYKFLELEPKNFSRWCNTNIKNNKFAIENEDYYSCLNTEDVLTQWKNFYMNVYNLVKDYLNKEI